MFEGYPNPCVFAHRGASAHAPENTLAAFKLAMEIGAPAIELDAKLTKDGQIVVIHDQTLLRTTGAQGKVNEMTLSDLRRLEAGGFFSEKFRGEPIPTLQEVFELVDKAMWINVELTNYATPNDDLVSKVVELVEKMKYQDRVLFSSFNPRNLAQAKKRLPDVPCGLLALPGLSGLWARSFFNRWTPHDALHPYLKDITTALVGQYHRVNKRVHVWTVNQKIDMERLLQKHVDGIFTDNPRLALQMLSDYSSGRASSMGENGFVDLQQ